MGKGQRRVQPGAVSDSDQEFSMEEDEGRTLRGL